MPRFDARVFNVPTLDEAANCFLWREHSSVRSRSRLARAAVQERGFAVKV